MISIQPLCSPAFVVVIILLIFTNVNSVRKNNFRKVIDKSIEKGKHVFTCQCFRSKTYDPKSEEINDENIDKREDEKNDQEELSFLRSLSDKECILCRDELSTVTLKPCNHKFGNLCANQLEVDSSICPYCRATIEKFKGLNEQLIPNKKCSYCKDRDACVDLMPCFDKICNVCAVELKQNFPRCCILCSTTITQFNVNSSDTKETIPNQQE
ncbi:uncharacterized protein LOC126906063 isoform X2 [Daktulosphaira vitifoliae]|uniref:uncharacterized protein LOC126906063 isoform X2 n=1 Tax=Daktulosphaira vitifoliae TaxID=58002 RepID=UPI0021AACA25|nr:uncharacterized protein LOC126906063 isoform X2 [Daktulosphaira vitifoliae]